MYNYLMRMMSSLGNKDEGQLAQFNINSNLGFTPVDNDSVKQIDWDPQARSHQFEGTPRNDYSTKLMPELSDVDSVLPMNGNASLGKRTLMHESMMAEPPSPMSGRSNANLLTLSHPHKMIKMEQRSPRMSMASPVVTFDKNGNFDQDPDQMSSKSGFDDILDHMDNRSQQGFTELEDFISKKEEDRHYLSDF